MEQTPPEHVHRSVVGEPRVFHDAESFMAHVHIETEGIFPGWREFGGRCPRNLSLEPERQELICIQFCLRKIYFPQYFFSSSSRAPRELGCPAP